ncbi:gelsolin-like protein 1 [Lineus longissimus]|uniref:gelsolin-like protein 1 n=1 Tax=Lineus longissimus TaxID=88925 RepID=UPI002B4F9F5C
MGLNKMQKAKKYDWKDSNMALFGSDTEKSVKKESAQQEKAWEATENLAGTQTVIFRVVKFKVTEWPKEQYGEFYNGDSYIIYHQEKNDEDDSLEKHVHFWIGKYSTQDEYGTAAYKTVELDTLHDDEPIQHREVQGNESALFKSYFEDLTLLKGGAETGFRRVLPEAYSPRLFHIQKIGRKIQSTQVSLKKGNLTSDDVFLIDLGSKIYQWNGSKCSHDEKFKAAQEIQRIASSRGKCKSETLEENSTSSDHPALIVLKDGEIKKKPLGEKIVPKLFCVSDADGPLDLEEKASGSDVSKDKLSSDDIYIIDLEDHCYCWVGSGASIDERRNGLTYASNYLNKTDHPYNPISVVSEGKEDQAFKESF